MLYYSTYMNNDTKHIIHESNTHNYVVILLVSGHLLDLEGEAIDYIDE